VDARVTPIVLDPGHDCSNCLSPPLNHLQEAIASRDQEARDALKFITASRDLQYIRDHFRGLKYCRCTKIHKLAHEFVVSSPQWFQRAPPLTNDENSFVFSV
jgi:hypothetical protein